MDDVRFYCKVMKALSNPHRLELFLAVLRRQQPESKAPTPVPASELPEGCCFLTPIAKRLGIGMPTVSHHLKELVHAELIDTIKVGKFVGVSVNLDTWNRFKKGLLNDKSK